MDWLGWICGSCCFITFLGVAGFLLFAGVAAINDHLKTRKVINKGDQTFAFLVQANQNLFEKGWLDAPAAAIISPSHEVTNDDDFMFDLAERVYDLKGLSADECDSPELAEIAAVLNEEEYEEGRRLPIPKSFTQGREVYLVSVMIDRDHLPQEKLTINKIACAILWEQPGSVITTRPANYQPVYKPPRN